MKISKYIILISLNFEENAVEAKIFLRVDENGNDRSWNYSSFPPEKTFLSKIKGHGDKAYKEAEKSAMKAAADYLYSKGYNNFQYIY